LTGIDLDPVGNVEGSARQEWIEGVSQSSQTIWIVRCLTPPGGGVDPNVVNRKGPIRATIPRLIRVELKRKVGNTTNGDVFELIELKVVSPVRSHVIQRQPSAGVIPLLDVLIAFRR